MRLTGATKAFCTAQLPSKKNMDDIQKDTLRYKFSEHIPKADVAVYDFTSVELGHGCKGIHLSQEILPCTTTVAQNNYIDCGDSTLVALRAASVMHYQLARESDKIHGDFKRLASATYDLTGGFAKVMLGRP